MGTFEMTPGAAIAAMSRCQLAVIALSSLLAGVQPQAQAGRPASDPRIRTELVTATQAERVGEPIVIDVYLQNLGYVWR